MKKRLVSIALAGALVGGAFSALPAVAQTAPTIPDEVMIDDPFGDGNYLNEQGQRVLLGHQGDHTTPADAASVSDLGKIWFENDAESISLHIQTQAKGPATLALFYRLYANPGEGSEGSSSFGCLQFTFFSEGAGYLSDSNARISDVCNAAESAEAEFEWADGPDETGILTIKAHRSYSPLFADDSVITSAFAQTTHATGPTPQGTLVSPHVDSTDFGIDYTISSDEPKVEEPPKNKGKKDKAPAKKGCKKNKNKGKKKGCKKGKGPKEEPKAGCEAYVPGENGAEAETLMVTDSATEEEPVTVEFDAGVGLGAPIVGGVPVPPDQRTHNYHNVQVDGDSPEVGLYVRLEFTDRRDYDLFLEYPDGTEGTHSGDFNTAHEVFSCGDEATGCEGGSNFEQVNGIRTADCQGWTTDSVAFLTEGGDVTLSLWLGEIQNDPAPPAE